MRPRITLISLIAALCLMAGCDAISYTDNRVFGKFPSVYVELGRQLRADGRRMRLEILKVERSTRTTSRDSEASKLRKTEKRQRRLMKVKSKYAVLEMERRQQAQRIAAEELAEVKGKAVPFSFEYSDPDFDVSAVEISDGDPATGTLTLSVKVVARRNLAARNANLYFVVLDGTGRRHIHKGTVDPFGNTENGAPVSAGELCDSNGSPLILDCTARNFVSFSRLVFTDRATYESIR